MKRENLLLITGAGASYDSINERDASIAGKMEFKPPLTKDLFTPCFTDKVETPEPNEKHHITYCLKTNRKAYQVGYGININPKEGLEAKLNKLKNSKNITDKKLYWTVPIYLNELFNEVSKFYLPGGRAPSNYYQLLLELNRSKYKKVIWINLNYDLLADYAIGEFTGERVVDFEQHMKIKYDDLSIKYTKPHGSVNWYYRYKEGFNLSLHQIKEGDVPQNLEAHFGGICYDPKGKFQGNANYYPAITAPIADYEFIYKPHYDEIKKDLPDIDAILCIGFSGLDKDVLDLIKTDVGKIHRFKLVDTSNAEDVFSRIKAYCQNIVCGYSENTICQHGFTEFCQGDLQKWVQ